MANSDDNTAEPSCWVVSNPGASHGAIAALTSAAPFALPELYVGLLRRVNGGEAEIVRAGDIEPSWLCLWAAEEVIQFNAEYELAVYAPSFFAFGMNGGGELFAFDGRRDDDAVFMLPAIGLADDTAMRFANSLARFVSAVAAKPKS